VLTNTRTLSVEFGHCDPSGIVYNPNYFVWFDMSVHALLAHGGISLKSAIEQFGIDGIPVVEYQVKFLAPSR
jgi:4-hydroxybenzoyl-CoA thioesterase